MKRAGWTTDAGGLFGPEPHGVRRPSPWFQPQRIVLARGSETTPERRALAAAICAACPQAEVLHRPDIPHNRFDLGHRDALRLHRIGKRTLVLGEHCSAVRFSQEAGNACPNYWHFSPYGFCPYDCQYCYLAGTPGVRFSPTVKIFLNLPEMLAQIDRLATRLGRPTAFYVGKLQDGLALDRLTGYSRVMVPFFAQHRFARLILLTKCPDVDNLLDLEHRGHTILSWSVNPPEVAAVFEMNTPTVSERLEAMKRAAQAGYPVRAVLMPIIPVPDWERLYAAFLEHLLAQVPLARLTLGGICMYGRARQLMERKLGRANPISEALGRGAPRSSDGRRRFSLDCRVKLYGRLIEAIRRRRPRLEVGLCLEERPVFQALGLADSAGRCNCVL